MAKKQHKPSGKAKPTVRTSVTVRRVPPRESPGKSNLANGAESGRGGFREGAGRKPDMVKALERELLDALYSVPVRTTAPDGKVSITQGDKKELGLMCIERLIEILHGDDIPSAVRAGDILLSRKFGKAAEHREVKVDAQIETGIYIIPPPVIARLPGAEES